MRIKYIISPRKDIYRNVLLFSFFFWTSFPLSSTIKCDPSVVILRNERGRVKRWSDKIERLAMKVNGELENSWRYLTTFEGRRKITPTFFLINYPPGYKNLLINRIQVTYLLFHHLITLSYTNKIWGIYFFVSRRRDTIIRKIEANTHQRVHLRIGDVVRFLLSDL